MNFFTASQGQRSQADCRALLLVLLLSGFALAAGGGCRTQARQGSLSLPADNRVRLVARRIEKASPEGTHWKWSVIGERNWKKPGVTVDESGIIASLGSTYPLNSTSERGGCNIWECDLIVRPKPGGDAGDPPSQQWEMIVHGSNGMTARDTGNVAAGFAIRIREDRDSSVRGLPADLHLADVGDKRVTLRIEK